MLFAIHCPYFSWIVSTWATVLDLKYFLKFFQKLQDSLSPWDRKRLQHLQIASITDKTLLRQSNHCVCVCNQEFRYNIFGINVTFKENNKTTLKHWRNYYVEVFRCYENQLVALLFSLTLCLFYFTLSICYD